MPNIVIASNKLSLLSGETATITFTLSEPSTDFTVSDITVIGGTLSNFSGSGTSYTATFIPDVNSTTNGVISVTSGKFSDIIGTFNTDGSEENNTVTISVNTIVSTTRITKKISDLISSQLPEYITLSFPIFKLFIEKYYKFIEQDQGAQELLQNIFLYADIDKTISSLLDYFAEQYTKFIPKNILVDKAFFIKLASELYTRKGTEESFRILFRALFNEEIDFFYPSTVILKPSDGTWDIPHIMRVNSYVGSPFNMAGTLIRGRNSIATAVVENVVSLNYYGNTIYELRLDRNSIKGTFIPEEQIISRKLQNAITGNTIVTVANINSILSKVDVVYSGPGYAVNDRVTVSGGTGTGATAYVYKVFNSGKIKSIYVDEFGVNYTVKPDVTIGPPSAKFDGKYKIINNDIIVRLINEHDSISGCNVILSFSGNTSSVLNDSTRLFTIDKIIDKYTFIANVSNYIGRTITVDNTITTVDDSIITADQGVKLFDTNGNVTLVHTLDKFFKTNFTLTDNVIRTSVPIEHDLSIGDVVKIKFDDIIGETIQGNFVLKNYNNVTIGFNTDHGLNQNEKINVRYDFNHSNATLGTYNLTSLYFNAVDSSNNIVTVDNTSITVDYTNAYYNNARIDFDSYPHYFNLNQNVNVNFRETLTNAISGSFLLENSIATVFFENDHNFVLNENVNASFSNAKLIDDKDKIQIKGNANVIFGSNILYGNDTEFKSNIFIGNIISVGRLQEFIVANVVSNTIAYLASNSEYTLNYSNVYQVTSNLNGNVSILKVTQIPNKRRIYADIVNMPNTTGKVLVSSIVSNVVQNTYAIGVVTNNGYPFYNFIDVQFPLNTANNNARGIALVSNADTSNIIGHSANLITISSIPNSKTIIFNSTISSNIANTSGNATVTVALPNFANYFHDGSCTLSTGDVEEILPEVNLTGDIVFYYNSEAMTEYGVLRVPNKKTIELASVQPNTRGRLSISFSKDANLQANIGAIGVKLGNWKDHRSILDETFKLQGRIDNNKKVYYQTFSYVIRSSKALNIWEKIVKQNIHPAGFEIFSEVFVRESKKITSNVALSQNIVMGPLEASNTIISIDNILYTSDHIMTRPHIVEPPAGLGPLEASNTIVSIDDIIYTSDHAML